MRTVHVLQHVPMEGAACIGTVARELGLAVVEYPLFDRPPPAAIPPRDLLVVMGGSMGVGDIGDPRWPFLAPELSLLSRTLREGRAVLGVCLGAQLMAHALGARVYPLAVGEPPARVREVGWGAITFDPRSKGDPALAGLDDSEVVVHWHGDTFDLPAGAVPLASSLFCENQMFRFGSCAYALQFHIELTAEDVPEWVRLDHDFVAAAGGAAGARRVIDETPRRIGRFRQMGDRMIRNIFTASLASGT